MLFPTRRWAEGKGAAFVIARAPGSQGLGMIEVHQVAGDPGLAEVGYWLRREARGPAEPADCTRKPGFPAGGRTGRFHPRGPAAGLVANGRRPPQQRDVLSAAALAVGGRGGGRVVCDTILGRGAILGLGGRDFGGGLGGGTLDRR